jgi:hypothetical protein
MRPAVARATRPHSSATDARPEATGPVVVSVLHELRLQDLPAITASLAQRKRLDAAGARLSGSRQAMLPTIGCLAVGSDESYAAIVEGNLGRTKPLRARGKEYFYLFPPSLKK